jgi:serine/threonine protein kinase
MGEVYRARDTRLGRDVAIKVLPEAFAADAERLARFEREARTLAAINHANIAAIYGIESHSAGSGQTNALVMELVEGQDLSELIGALENQGALRTPVRPAYALRRRCRWHAEAVERHRQQIGNGVS